MTDWMQFPGFMTPPKRREVILHPRFEAQKPLPSQEHNITLTVLVWRITYQAESGQKQEVGGIRAFELPRLRFTDVVGAPVIVYYDISDDDQTVWILDVQPWETDEVITLDGPW